MDPEGCITAETPDWTNFYIEKKHLQPLHHIKLFFINQSQIKPGCPVNSCFVMDLTSLKAKMRLNLTKSFIE